jgi:uncharacterized protein YndB with AHSA1/START domain
MNEESGLRRLTLNYVLGVPRERVFRMLTEPAELVKWWGPHGIMLLTADVDLRIGGGYRFVMKPSEGPAFHLSGQFLSVDPPDGLSYTFEYEEPTPDDRETVVSLALEDRGQDTVLSLTQGVFATEERLALHRVGWSDSLERLKAVIEG